MVAASHPDPAHTLARRLVHRHAGREAHDEMTHAVVAVDEGHRVRLARHVDARPHVHRPSPDATHVLGKAEDPVAIGPAQIGIDHEAGDVGGVLGR